MILAGDIGGTKTILALFEETPSGLRQVHEQLFKSAAYDSLRAVVQVFVEGQPNLKLRAACFGVAGVVADGEARATNLKWDVKESVLAALLSGVKVRLLNDLVATACGVPHLTAGDTEILNPGRSGRPGNIAVIAAGTGLGEAALVWDGHGYLPMATEGGHADFAPRDERECDLLRYLQASVGGRVSYERVLSGPGFYNIYCFLRDRGYAPEPAWLRERIAAEPDPSATVSMAGMRGEAELAVMTLELFASLYGAEAGNLALRMLALGGVYVAGGIAPKVLPALRGGGFMRSFLAKGRFAAMLSEIPVKVSLNPRTALIGAAHFALTL